MFGAMYQCILTSVKWLEQRNIFKSICFSSSQSSFIPKFLVDFCEKICRALTVLASIITSDNKIILRHNIQDYACNCRKENKCPLQNKCLTPDIVYQAIVTNNIGIVKKIYFKLCETSFKERYHNHTSSFRLQSRSKDTELSKYVWELKNENKIPFIKWRILKKVYAKPRFNYCKLCLMEKLYIDSSIREETLLNKKSEFVSKCRHQNKLLIKEWVIKR